jgi:hypothetical protein
MVADKLMETSPSDDAVFSEIGLKPSKPGTGNALRDKKFRLFRERIRPGRVPSQV